ncbi:MAG: TlpA family protein disulfide reductase [Bacteroidales bacterium]|nr:TlpA family protein disulfide reductase [Bacteroidales bacterium]
MKRCILWTAIVFPCFLFVLSGCINDKSETGASLVVGDRLPDFEVVMNDGSVVSSEGLAGHVSCIVFFNTSCPDCRKTLPSVRRVYEEYWQKGVSFALISRSESEGDILPYWEENGFEMPFSAQETRYVYSLFADKGVPRIYISDRNGTIRYIFTDSPVPSYHELHAALDALYVE